MRDVEIRLLATMVAFALTGCGGQMPAEMEEPAGAADPATATQRRLALYRAWARLRRTTFGGRRETPRNQAFKEAARRVGRLSSPFLSVANHGSHGFRIGIPAS